MCTVTRDCKRRSVPLPHLTPNQRSWIRMKDQVGAAVDRFLETEPSPEMRTAVERVEDGLRLGDHASGLLIDPRELAPELRRARKR